MGQCDPSAFLGITFQNIKKNKFFLPNICVILAKVKKKWSAYLSILVEKEM